MAEEPKDFSAENNSSGWEEIKKKILSEYLWPSIRFELSPTDQDEVALGATRFGGDPDLPEDAVWPTYKEVPLGFICQINLEELPQEEVVNQLPRAGLLSFFFLDSDMAYGEKGSGQVIFTDKDKPLKRHETPSKLIQMVEDEIEDPFYVFTGRLNPCKTRQFADHNLPSAESSFVESLDLTHEQRDQYLDLREEYIDESDPPAHRILGHADQIQGDMQLECELRLRGLDPFDHSVDNNPQIEEIKEAALEWRLLFQADSDSEQGSMWGDVGQIYYWIRKDDLRTARFDNVLVDMQCC